MKRIFLIVLDSFGVGHAPDAADFGDLGSDTLSAVCTAENFSLPNLARMGLFHIEETPGESVGLPLAAYGRMTEQSRGKDTTIGHWELMGIRSNTPLPVYPEGFPQPVLDAFSAATGRGVLCNRPYSGTQVIYDYGRAHQETGDLIVYTSADSVFQIAAHEELVPPETLYDYCRAAREILTGTHGVGRVIARPFVGKWPDYTRTANRHDFSLLPPAKTALDLLKESGYDVIGVGKIGDIFAGQGLTESIPTRGNADGMAKTDEVAARDFNGLCFVNLVDFDSSYGHRNDVKGYANALMEFDRWLGGFLSKLGEDDVLIITADHGCDPSTESTDHSRERVPLLIYGNRVRPVHLGTRESFADLGSTVLQMFSVDGSAITGESFWEQIRKEQ